MGAGQVTTKALKGPWGPSEGVALPLMLFLLMALTFLGHGSLLLARRDLQASRVFLQATQAREAARSALLAATDFGEAIQASRESGGRGRLFQEDWGDGAKRGATVQWLSRELFLVEGEGSARGWPGAKRVGGVGWMLDPPTRMASFRGGLEVGKDVTVLRGSSVSNTSFFESPRGWEEAECHPHKSVLDSLFGSVPPPLSSPPYMNWGGGSGEVPPLGHLDEPYLLARSAEVVQELNPGGGEGPGKGCPGAGGPVFWGVEGSLTLRSGEICGLLVVTGDLTLQGDGVFQGIVLVGGGLTLGGGWTFQGMGRVGGSVTVGGSSLLETSGCAALRTLADLSALHDPILLPHAANITSF